MVGGLVGGGSESATTMARENWAVGNRNTHTHNRIIAAAAVKHGDSAADGCELYGYGGGSMYASNNSFQQKVSLSCLYFFMLWSSVVQNENVEE
jgi:hypothetical protein